MTTQEVQTITGEHWEEFLKWMDGQTVGIYPDGGKNYYVWDVERFMRQFESK